MTEAQRKKQNSTYSKLIIGTFSTDLGTKLLVRLQEVFMDRPIYTKGASIEDVAYRQGQYDLVAQLKKELK